MSNLWLNWRFGARHLQIGRWFESVSFRVNTYHLTNKPKCWFERY